MMSDRGGDLEEAAALLLGADSVFVGAGAGFSADCGLLTYQDVEKAGVSYRDVCSPDALAKDAGAFFGWVDSCIASYSGPEPHLGYTVLRRLREGSSKAGPKRMFVLTTNVDGLFQRSGLAEGLCETHGSYSRWQCSGLRRTPGLPSYQSFEKPCTDEVWPDRPRGTTEEGHPACPHCGKCARPNVYLFGDTNFLPDQSQERSLFDFQEELLRSAPSPTAASPSVVFLELGVGLRLPKISVLFQRLIRRMPSGAARIIRVNKDPPPSSSHPNTLHFQLSSLEFFTAFSNQYLE